jgi:hypothetical protein
MKVEEIFRFALKSAQFIVTFLLLYAIGFPYWMIVAAALLVPIYGIYLMLRSPGKTKGGTPYADYKLNAIARSWHKVDISLCITMAVVCLIFSLLLFFFYFMFSTFTTKILLSACCSLLLSILYALNGILVTRKLQSGTIDFSANHKLFTTSTSKSSPLTQKTNDKALDLFGSSRKRDESFSKYSESKNRHNSNAEEIEIRRKSAVPSPEPPKSPTDDEVPYNFQTAKQPLSQQYSVERRPRVTSWFTDVGDNNKKDITTTIESSFMTPTDPTKEGDHLDAREQYIKSKQYRDFMDPNPNKKGIAKKSSTKIQEKTMEDFNEKFAAIAASNENLEKEGQNASTGPPSSAINEKNYKLGTTPYTRKPMPTESRKENEEYLHKPFQQQNILIKKQLPLTNNFNESHSSQGSYWSSQTELDKAFAHKKQSYTERAIDIGSYKASPVEIFEDADRKHSDTHSSGTLHSLDDVEATPKAPRQALSYPPSHHPLPTNANPFNISASTTKSSRRSIGVDDSPGTPIKYHIKETHGEFHEMPPARIAIKSAVIPQKGVITGIARPYSFQGQSREDLSSTPSRSISSLTGSSSAIRNNSEVAESTASSTIRVDDIDRGNTRSPLRDNSLMTTSTIVNMNSTSIKDWSSSSSSSNTDSRKESSQLRIQNSRTTPQKQGFDVIIRPRDSPIDNGNNNRPQSVTPSTATTEFVPRYTNSSTTLTIKSSPDYSQNRHLSTQF